MSQNPVDHAATYGTPAELRQAADESHQVRKARDCKFIDGYRY